VRHYPRNHQSRKASAAGGEKTGRHGAGQDVSRYDRSHRFGKVQATATVTTAANYSDADTVVIGGLTYTMQTVLVDAARNVLIGANEAATIVNLTRAINASGGTPGTDYGTATTAHPNVTATNDGAHIITLTAKRRGGFGNTITLTKTGATTVSGATLAGGF
jgi:hypothetical protein